MAGIVFLLAVAVSAWICCSIFLPGTAWPLRWLSAMVIAGALVLLPVQVMAALELAGWIGSIQAWGLAGAQLVLLAGVWVLARRVRSSSGNVARQGKAFALPTLPSYLWVCGAVLTGSCLLFAANLLTSYPSGFDSLAYHLPVALRWLQNGSLRIPSLNAWQFGLPGNAEIVMMLFLSSGHQAAAPLVNVFALVLLGVATYTIAFRLAHENTAAAATVTVIGLSMPIVEFQAFSGYVDLFGTAFLVSAVALFLSRNGEKGLAPEWGTKALLLLSAMACGVSIGTKPVFYVYAAVYCLVVAIALMRESGTGNRRFFLGLALVFVGVLLPSLFWFGRALAATGNPLFPMQVKVGQHVLLRGFAPTEITANEFSDKFVRRRAEWLVYPWTEYLRNPGEQLVPYSEGSGTGAAFAAFVPLGLLFACFRLASRRSSSTETTLLLVCAGLSVVWWTSLQRMPRFGLPLLVLGCVLSAPLVVVLEEYARKRFAILLVACVLATCSISAFVPLRELAGRVKSHGWSRSHVYGYPELVDNLPPGTTLLNNTGNLDANFSLAGKRLSNRVIATFEVPNPVTSEFLAEQHVGFVVEATQANGDKIGSRETAQFSPGNRESFSATAGNKQWTFWKIRPAVPAANLSVSGR